MGERKREGDALGAARLCRRLGLEARNRGDADSARRHLEAGVAILADLPPSEELVDLHHARLLVDSPLFDPERATDTVAALVGVARTLSSPRAAVESLSAEGQLALGRGDYDLARARAEEALRIAEESGDWLLMQRSRRDLVWVTWAMADLDASYRQIDAQLELDRLLGTRAQEPLSRFQFAIMAHLGGRWDEVVPLAEEAITQARRYGQGRILTIVHGTLSWFFTDRGDLDLAAQHLAEARQTVDIKGGDRALHFTRMPEAALALERGDAVGAQAAVAGLRLPAARALLGTAQVLAGDLDSAQATGQSLATSAVAGSYPAALADRVLGLVAQARGDTDGAREALERSAAALAALGLPFETAVSQFHAGTVENVRAALATFETLGAARHADRARRALRGLGVRVPSRRRRGGDNQPLSGRELEVARLVAEGLTNAEIASRLVLSTRTIESHLDHIYARLGISTRAALASWVTTAEAPVT
jgi:ATP/maltotriose-dependent transcriptional regulator MalT